VIGAVYQDFAQQLLQLLCDAPEVVTGGGEDGVEAIAFTGHWIISIQSMFLIKVADKGLNGRAPP